MFPKPLGNPNPDGNSHFWRGQQGLLTRVGGVVVLILSRGSGRLGTLQKQGCLSWRRSKTFFLTPEAQFPLKNLDFTTEVDPMSIIFN